MPAEVIMPALGMAQEAGTVLRWLKSEGDSVSKGEPLLEVETDKVTVAIEAPADGTLAGVSALAGEEVPVGTAIAFVLASGEALPDSAERADRQGDGRTARLSETVLPGAVAPEPTITTTERSGRRLASPRARRLAAAHGVDLASLGGSGPGGAVVAADVEAAAADSHAGAGIAVGAVWRRMAERVTRSWQDVPQFVLSRSVDASRLVSWRDAARRKPGCDELTLTDLLVKVCAEGLGRHPRVNASWRDGTVVPGPGINVGIAVATDDALVVPVVHDADRLPLAELCQRRRELAESARQGTLRPEAVQGGTFTISNLGMYGVDAFEAIVNAPQAAILAVGRIVEQPVAVGGEVYVRPVLTLTLSFDHRVVDGARAAEFLDTVASLVEEPAGLVG